MHLQMLLGVWEFFLSQIQNIKFIWEADVLIHAVVYSIYCCPAYSFYYVTTGRLSLTFGRRMNRATCLWLPLNGAAQKAIPGRGNAMSSSLAQFLLFGMSPMSSRNFRWFFFSTSQSTDSAFDHIFKWESAEIFTFISQMPFHMALSLPLKLLAGPWQCCMEHICPCSFISTSLWE